MFTKATKTQAKCRLALQGPSGGGKTYSALAIGTNLGSKVAVIDSEHGSASKYADQFGFDTCSLIGDYHPQRYIDAMKNAAEAGYDVIVADSLTHAWNGTGGFLELVDAEVKRMISKGQRADSFAAWKVVTPIYNKLIQAILSSPCHVIVTLRAKQEYEKTKDDNGKVSVKKVGMAPEIRDNFQYEMDIEGMLTMEHDFVIGKTRCRELDGKIFRNPGKDLADILRLWLSDGAPAVIQDSRIVNEPTLAEEISAAIDWKAQARVLYAKLPKDQAEEIRIRNGENFEAMCHELASKVPA